MRRASNRYRRSRKIPEGQLILFYTPSIAEDRSELHRLCGDCDVDIHSICEYYIVRDEVSPMHPDGGVLCVCCLEGRIGRSLTPDDFTDCYVNRRLCR
jgi:ribosomal protein L34E